VDSLIEFNTRSPEETFALGQKIATYLRQGSVVALQGALGSGKTCLVKGIAKGLGIEETITSPTYTIINEYLLPQNNKKGKIVRHMDIYRLNGDNDFYEIGGDELIRSGDISLIEWSERIERTLPHDTIRILLEITGPLSRLIKIEGLEIQ
jgi:tRNA threonylcarbamoyladenosine biosynthesis protein TsaE